VLQNILKIRPNAKTVPLSSRRFMNKLTLEDATYHLCDGTPSVDYRAASMQAILNLTQHTIVGAMTER